jgi:2-dehydro-3-deoxyphosphogluconate aldolase/(4S)-4-hydroxy-2-oxoglutarate aldolase
MMTKYETLTKIKDVGVVAVVRAENAEQGQKIAESCIKGGIPAIEITYTVPGATEVISTLTTTFTHNQLIIGAGTVLDSETARIAILSGAKYIVSPAFDFETCKLCNRYQIPYMPGCMTITEIIHAMEAGAEVIKIFPGSVFGPGFIKAIKGPLPQAQLLPTGGVSLDNAAEWIKNGSFALGVGGELTKGAKTGNYDLITETATKLVAAVANARGE